MKQFEEYLEKLKSTVTERKPINDKEDGFRIAVMLIYHNYQRRDHVLNNLTKNISEIDFGKSDLNNLN